MIVKVTDLRFLNKIVHFIQYYLTYAIREKTNDRAVSFKCFDIEFGSQN